MVPYFSILQTCTEFRDGWKKSKTGESKHGFLDTEGNRGKVFLDLGIIHP